MKPMNNFFLFTDIDILNGLTWTNDLDEVWKANREKDAGLLWQYFGSQSGIMRNYPGLSYYISSL